MYLNGSMCSQDTSDGEAARRMYQSSFALRAERNRPLPSILYFYQLCCLRNKYEEAYEAKVFELLVKITIFECN